MANTTTKLQTRTKLKMKKAIYTLLAMSFLAACQTEDVSDLGKLRTERDSLNTVQKEITTRLKEIESKLALVDSNSNLHSVTIVSVNPQPFAHYFKVYGKVESNKSINLYAETSGRINNILVKRGQNVAKGQLLAEIDASILIQNIAEVKTSLELANELYKKQSKLWLEDKIGSEVQYLQAKNNKESLDRRLETLNAQLAMTKVRAPFNGVIDDIFPKDGEMASPQMAMFRLVNLSEVYLTSSVSEAYVGKIAVGTPAKVTFKSLGKTVESDVVRVGNFINPDNRTFEINVALGNDLNYKPNMMASVDLQDYKVDEALVVPTRLVMETSSGESYVYVLEGKGAEIATVKRVIINTGVSYDGQTEVLSGLSGGENVVDKGSRSVKEGQKVRVVILAE